MLAAAALAVSGCGKAAPTSPAELALEREDLVAVSRALENLESQTETEVVAAKAAWPAIVDGLPNRSSGLYSEAIRQAIETAGRLSLPSVFSAKQAAALTGAASGITGLYRAFSGLTSRGWQMLGASIYQIEHGTRVAARFARENVALYIDSIYDAHFGLGQIGKQLQRAYAKLGGEGVFGAALTQVEVDGLVATYSEARDRLDPHVGVKFGS